MRNEGKCSGCNPLVGSAGGSMAQDEELDRFESVDRKFLEETARLTHNYIQLEELAGKLFGYQYMSPPTQCAPDEATTKQPSVVARLNNSVENLQHANYRLEELIEAFKQ